MCGDNRNRWTSPQMKLLEEMQAAGRQWPAIAAAVGHPLNSCQQMLSRIRGAKRNAEFERSRMARAAPPQLRLHNRNPWLPFQLKLLDQLADSGTPWAEIASRVGHSQNSCATKMSEIRAKRRNDTGEPPFKPAWRPKNYVPSQPLAPATPPSPPSARSCRTSTLLADAELRARIEVLGVTSGLLGDPLPGRSALDRMRAGIVETSAPRPGERRPASITLAAEPLR